ncbi:hypothetical protein BD560DRAFT_417399 [Blakeslea trispora]|nr:hypothetical protein BD560DRAFT_417399 [Blakeslea trispora]
MTKELPTEVILCFASLLTSELDKFSFAFANKRHWSICLYMEHVFSNAAHLHTVVINKRKLYSFSFALLLLQSVPSNKMVTFVVPHAFYRKLSFMIQEDNLTNISLKIDQDGVMVDTTKIVTPEHARVQIDETKQALKRQHYLNHPEAAIFKNELCHLIAASINRFLNAKSYLLDDDDFSNDVLMKKTDMNTKEARQLIDTHCPKFVRSVVILAGYWFLITSFSSFIHINISIDNYANSSKVGYQDKAVGFVRIKTMLVKDYFELTLRFGFVESLATGGFFGSIDDSYFSPFLGSSIQELSTQITAAIETISTSSVYILKEPVAHVCNNRSLNQFYKSHARNNWGFFSQRFEDEGFSPANPLQFGSENVMQVAASLVLRSLAFQQVYEKSMKTTVPKVLALEESLLTAAQRTTKKLLLFLYEHKSSSFLLLDKKETKRDAIEIYSNILTNATKTKNMNIAKDAKKRYQRRSIDLFN